MASRSDPNLPEEIEEYIKETFDYSLGLPVSTNTLEMKLQASEEARRRLQDQYFLLHSRLKEKDETIERARSEASMNAQALKRFVEENQKLAAECTHLLSQCSRWEKECSLYDRDREALMEFANEADERAKDAEARANEAEEELRLLSEQVEFYRKECQMHSLNEKNATDELRSLRERISELERLRFEGCSTDDQLLHISGAMHGGGSELTSSLEEHLLDSMITSVIDKDGVAESARAFLEGNSGLEPCERLLQMWDRLRLSTRNIIALASEVQTLHHEKEHLRINLTRAEDEVKVLFDENNILDEENKRLLRRYSREKNHHGSGGKHTSSASSKGSKRKSSPKTSSPVERMIDFNSSDSPRQPLSPLLHNSPNSRMYKK